MDTNKNIIQHLNNHLLDSLTEILTDKNNGLNENIRFSYGNKTIKELSDARDILNKNKLYHPNISKKNIIESLPDIGVMKSKTYSGFLPTSDKNDGFLFYLFIESFNKPETDPVILWLQGGPGTSSLFGAFVENGPYLIDENGKWKFNEWHWANNASVLWIDNPVGTGFSYTINENYVRKENDLSLQLYYALKKFFTLYDNFSNNKFYIFGESYAGKYIPWLAKKILEESKLNLKGIGIGDGLVNPKWQTFSYSEYLYKMGYIDSQIKTYSDAFLDRYVELLDNKNFEDAKDYDNSLSLLLQLYANIGNPFNIKQQKDPSHAALKKLTKWLNYPNVKMALNVANCCFSKGDEAKDALEEDHEKSVLHVLANVIEKIPILFYNGQLDYVCNFIGTKNYLLEMNWSGKKRYDESKENIWLLSGKKVGHYQSYGNLTRLVVYDSGHMVPFDVPEVSYRMLEQWINSHQ